MTSALLLLLLDSRSPAGAHGHSGGMEAAVTAGFVHGVGEVEQFCRVRLRTSGQAAAAFAAVACALWRADTGTARRAPPGAKVTADGAIAAGGPASDDCAPGSNVAARWAELDAEFGARVASPAARTASRQLGSGLRRLVRAMAPGADLATPWRAIPGPAPHHPLVLGAAVAIAGGDPGLAATAAALGTCAGPASAAVRLLGLDPYAVQGVLARLALEIDETGAAGAQYATGQLRADQPPAFGTAADQLPAGQLPAVRDLPALAAPVLELLPDVHARSEVRLFAS